MDVIKYFLVDSENVNDNWLMLLDLAEREDEIIVFYTKNSPHMSYASVIRLLQINRPVKFEECHEGNNGLDFQLVSYLGYLMKDEEAENAEFVIMSNDMGFDSAVNFWKDRNFHVNRINVNYCKLRLKDQQKNIPAGLDEVSETKEAAVKPAPVKAEETKPEAVKPEPAKAEAETVTESMKVEVAGAPAPKEQYNFNKEEVDVFINCIGRNNLTAIHETLVHVYGEKQGLEIYKTVKDKTYPLSERKYKREEKVKNFSDIVFSRSELKNPGNFDEFLENNKNKTKNLNGIRAAIVKSYGGGNGLKYYSLFKPYFKIISTLK